VLEVEVDTDLGLRNSDMSSKECAWVSLIERGTVERKRGRLGQRKAKIRPFLSPRLRRKKWSKPNTCDGVLYKAARRARE
jgi:hypothetical protein